jgi:hypothetical protein
VPMGPNALITVCGRRSALPRTTPITLIESAGRRWVLAPFGGSQLGAQSESRRERHDYRATANGRSHRCPVGP